MSRYVNKKHGLIIGSDNVFFIVNDKGAPEGVPEFRDGYRAIVWAKQFSFDQINSVNVFVETPANQILWDRVKIPVQEEEDRYPVDRTRFVLRKWPAHWLNTNVGAIHDMWDVRTYAQMSDKAVFFKRRKDALAFVRMIEKMLSGMNFRE